MMETTALVCLQQLLVDVIVSHFNRHGSVQNSVRTMIFLIFSTAQLFSDFISVANQLFFFFFFFF